MKKRIHGGTGYFLTEGVRSIFVHGFMSFAAVGVIVACLIIMGSFTLLTVNINDMIVSLGQSNEIAAFVDEELSDAQALSVGSSINALANVRDSVFVSREQALQDFIERFGEEDRKLLEGYENKNLFRHRYQITLMDISQIDDTISTLEQLRGVAGVRADMKIAQGLVAVRGVVRVISLALIVVLLLVSVFIISNTIKLATFDRKEEIAIMRMVGATKAFIRWPFVVQGVLIGLIGSAAAFFIQWFLYERLAGSITGTGASGIISIEILSFSELLMPVAAVFTAVGFFVGVGGSLLTIRKFLKV
ncbi:MAG: permease-like cell division protein FtsX [Oscillospiraceae bacterium]|jgi:cell division transport system permease protein|nr:permease-like cell division protein FtsX [Oscillospiraceae bacterium]